MVGWTCWLGSAFKQGCWLGFMVNRTTISWALQSPLVVEGLRLCTPARSCCWLYCNWAWLQARLHNCSWPGGASGWAPQLDGTTRWTLGAGEATGRALGSNEASGCALQSDKAITCAPKFSEPQAELYNQVVLGTCSTTGQGYWPGSVIRRGLQMYPTVEWD